ncbi:15006_t:CDS:10 [Funneliformis geosporum]|uniref:Glutamate--cysteine ligase n=1 Tax=Funneliformis geosporum TaxID=1117311 RepID=A0A9W4SFD1_9GLOM|nr:15006_t:CDS:10 [Funneliformis geosporum]
MGLLSFGTPLAWEEAKIYSDHVRVNGINHFSSIYHKLKNKQKDCLLWGDEVEYMVVTFDDENKNAKLSLRVFEILSELQKEEEAALQNSELNGTSWKPEFGRYMLEGTPGLPYGGTLKDILQVEPNMKFRRQLAAKYMKPNEVPITIASFPRLGCQGQFLEPHYEPRGEASRSLFVPDEIINPHARFPGSKVAINMPIFHDIKTPKPFIDPTIPRDRNLFPEDKEAAEGAALPDHIYMDAMVFGMGCCCLQITFQSCNIEEARRLYDQLANMGPIMLALTAAAPIYRGYLADVDCRWNVIAGSVDDRTKEERDLETLKPEYNDLDLVYDKEICKKLMDDGIDELLARHVAHLFIRDPLVIFKELNIQSTNWQTMRFKPPPPNSNIGWRVEFRSMEIQITDFENAAFAVFIVLLTRVILSYGLNFYIPISKVDENMLIAHKRDAVLNDKFWFRKNLFENEINNGINRESLNADGSSEEHHTNTQQPNGDTPTSIEDEYEQMSINEIINGDGDKFPGLIILIFRYLESVNIDIESRCMLGKYLEFVSRKAGGKLQTTAKWIREFVRSHPKYQQDSVVTQEINYDLMKMIDKVQKGEAGAPELLGGFGIDS